MWIADEISKRVCVIASIWPGITPEVLRDLPVAEAWAFMQQADDHQADVERQRREMERG